MHTWVAQTVKKYIKRAIDFGFSDAANLWKRQLIWLEKYFAVGGDAIQAFSTCFVVLMTTLFDGLLLFFCTCRV